jgi:glutathione S-transferase/RNA polymerase-associated protein
MLLVYEHPLSPYAQKVKIALREKKIPFEVKTPEVIGSGLAGGDFAETSPRAEVPAIVDDGVRVFDSTIILEYLEDKWPDPPLLPGSPAARARVRMIEDVCDTHYEAINWGIGEIRFFRRAEGALAETLLAGAAKQIAAMHRWLEPQIGEREWFNGDRFGWGDLSVAPYVSMSAMFGFPPAPGSALARWLDRIGQRPTVSQTFDEAVASTAGMGNFAALIESGQFKREFRDHRLEWMIKTGGIEVVQKGLEKGNIRFTGDFA